MTMISTPPAILRRVLWLAVYPLLVLGCNKVTPADAYGNFEAEEVVVSAQVGGQLQTFLPVEGSTLTAGQLAGHIDSTQLTFQRQQLVAQRASALSHRAAATDQLRALTVQHEIATRAQERVNRLFANKAATSSQRDQVERDERVLALQAKAAQAGITGAGSDIAALDARIAGVTDQLKHAALVNPVAGTVLATYARAGEVIQIGQPLYRVASLDTLTLRVYVEEVQLGAFRLGQQVAVHVDDPSSGLRAHSGVITWVSSRAEFTPTPVQTRDDRTNLVYAVKVRVANTDGRLKIGMPGDVTFAGAPPNATPTAPAATKP